jgi:hypothetical protein
LPTFPVHPHKELRRKPPQEETKSGDLGGQVVRLPFLSVVQENFQSVHHEQCSSNEAVFSLAKKTTIKFFYFQMREGEVLQKIKMQMFPVIVTSVKKLL